MHYCIHLITKELPTEEEISKIMKPYNDDMVEDYNDCPFSWDYWVIGGRYGGGIKLRINEEDEEYRWQFCSHKPREGKLFYSSILKQIRYSFPELRNSEEDWYQYLGYLDNCLYVDGAKIKDILNLKDLGCYICIDVNQNVIVRETWDGEHFITNQSFDEEYKRILEESKDYFLTILDVHD